MVWNVFFLLFMIDTGQLFVLARLGHLVQDYIATKLTFVQN